MSDARQIELDGYEARFGKYVEERGKFGKVSLTVGKQSFPVFWEDDEDLSDAENDESRRWFRRVLCNALHELVKAETVDNTKER